MIIFDAHLDLAWNAIDWNRDLRLPVRADPPVRERRRHDRQGARLQHRRPSPSCAAARSSSSSPRCLPASCASAPCRPSSAIGHMEAAYGACVRPARTTTAAWSRRAICAGSRTGPPLEAHVKAWKADEDSTTQPLGFILSMEGADPVLRPEQVAGVVGRRPAHHRPGPLRRQPLRPRHRHRGRPLPAGPALLLKEMERVGMILDVTHLSDQCFDEALDIYGGPVLASHHNNRTLVPDQRQLTDEQIKRLIERGAVIGHALDTWMLVPTGCAARPTRRWCQLENIVRPHRPRLPAGRQRQARRHRHRPRRRLRHGAIAQRPGHHRRPAKRARHAREARLQGGRHRRHHARQLGAFFREAWTKKK